MKTKVLAAAILSGAFIGMPVTAQETVPNNKGTPNSTNPTADIPREVLPSNPGQVAPKGPDFQQKLPGQQGTIPEVIQRPSGVAPKPMVVSADEIRRAQEMLKTKGYDPGAISGNLHAGTQEALRQFQKANGLTVTGVLDEKTAEKLGIDIRKEDRAPANKPDSAKPDSAKPDSAKPEGAKPNASTPNSGGR